MDIVLNSLLGISLSTLVTYFFGWLWYSPLLFGNLWLREQDLSNKDLQHAYKSMLFNFFIIFISSYFLHLVLKAFIVGDFISAAVVSLYVGVGFVGAEVFTRYLYSIKKKSIKLLLVDYFHRVFSYIVMGIVLSFFI